MTCADQLESRIEDLLQQIGQMSAEHAEDMRDITADANETRERLRQTTISLKDTQRQLDEALGLNRAHGQNALRLHLLLLEFRGAIKQFVEIFPEDMSSPRNGWSYQPDIIAAVENGRAILAKHYEMTVSDETGETHV